jgi:hypothetical protein
MDLTKARACTTCAFPAVSPACAALTLRHALKARGMKMYHPYDALGEEFVRRALAGDRPQMGGPGLAERLTKYAFYLTENQKTAGDALLVWDLHAAAKLARTDDTKTAAGA